MGSMQRIELVGLLLAVLPCADAQESLKIDQSPPRLPRSRASEASWKSHRSVSGCPRLDNFVSVSHTAGAGVARAERERERRERHRERRAQRERKREREKRERGTDRQTNIY